MFFAPDRVLAKSSSNRYALTGVGLRLETLIQCSILLQSGISAVCSALEGSIGYPVDTLLMDGAGSRKLAADSGFQGKGKCSGGRPLLERHQTGLARQITKAESGLRLFLEEASGRAAGETKGKHP
jgi:hypothetical protein